ncbi:hypothetical protein AL01_08040 [Bombella intestini]|uniref:Peptidase C51 domain-containing protein n=1 Tax=Bombella intestini TaxID=1539051 RepID=A0A1S8GP42_9PROT|nr:hypothetical protein AL01_08040 [Bombella intestini]
MRRAGKRLFLSCLMFSAAAFCAPKAEARHHVRHSSRIVRSGHFLHKHYRHYGHAHVIQCVAYVHQSTDFHIRGNARDWWRNAEGLYARGQQPETGAVLSFRPTRRMPLGHVAVVREQVDSRTILIDQAHWASNGISHNIKVVDVSPENDWTAVRVALAGNSGRLGSIYPTHGFIYNRPDGSAPDSPRYRNVLARGRASDMETASVPADTNFFGDEAPSRSLQ